MYKSGTIVMAMVWGRALLIRLEIVCVPLVNAGSTSECQDLSVISFSSANSSLLHMQLSNFPFIYMELLLSSSYLLEMRGFKI